MRKLLIGCIIGLILILVVTIATVSILYTNHTNVPEDELVEQSYTEDFQSFEILSENAGTKIVKLTEEQAREALHRWIGDLGTWDAGEENVLVCNGEYRCSGKDYYQFMLKGLVNGPDGTPSHFTTLTWYAISVDGSDMFEGQCMSGTPERW